MSAPKEYLELKAKHRIPDEDLQPFYIDNIFTQDALDELYDYINKHKSHFALKDWGIRTWHVPMPEIIKSQATAAILKHMPGLEFYEAGFGKYSTDWGLKNKLSPHADYPKIGRPIVKRHLDDLGIKSHEDDHRPQTIILDIQLKHDVDWPIFVEYEKFQLSDNQGLVFSGTQQIHWRNYMPVGTHVDMLFVHFVWADDRRQIDNQREITNERTDFICKDINLWSGEELLDSEETLYAHKKFDLYNM